MPAKAGVKKEIRERPARSRRAPADLRLVSVTGVTSARPGRSVLILIALAVFTLLLYSPVGKHPFIDYDDYNYVVENAHVKAGLTWNTFTWALTATEQSNWHPITWLSHALDAQLYGVNASGHHWSNLLIHTLNVVLLFLLLARVTRAPWRSMLVAALFALHPLNVESVVWIAERKNVLSTLFFLLALGAYGWYAQKPNIRRYLALALLFVLGLASKPMVITLPFVLLLLDFWPLHRVEELTKAGTAFRVQRASLSKLVLEKLPLLAISGASAAITMAAQSQEVVSTEALPVGIRLVAIPYSYALYLWKMFWPAHLAPIYPHPGRTLSGWQALLALLAVSIISVLAWAQRSRRPYLTVGWLWFLGTAVPIIGIVQVGNQIVADRYAYVPLIGIFVMVAWGSTELADRLKLRIVLRIATAVLILVALSFVTYRQIGYWSDTVGLWRHTLAVTNSNSMAEAFLANDLSNLGKVDEAMIHLRNYVALEPLDAIAHARVAADYQDRELFPLAIQEYEAAIRASRALNAKGYPGLPSEMLAISYINMAVIYRQLGDEAKAREFTNRALDTDPQAIDRMMGDLVQRIAKDRTPEGYFRLGMLLDVIGHHAEAEQAFGLAKQLDPNIQLPAMSQETRQ